MGEARPALRPSGGKHFSTISVFHSFAKAMLFFSLQLFWLISSFHAKPSFRGNLLKYHYSLSNGSVSTKNFTEFILRG